MQPQKIPELKAVLHITYNKKKSKNPGSFLQHSKTCHCWDSCWFSWCLSVCLYWPWARSFQTKLLHSTNPTSSKKCTSPTHPKLFCSTSSGFCTIQQTYLRAQDHAVQENTRRATRKTNEKTSYICHCKHLIKMFESWKTKLSTTTVCRVILCVEFVLFLLPHKFQKG